MSQLRDPNDKTTKTTAWLRSSLLKLALRLAEKQSMTYSEYLNHLVAEDVKRQKEIKDSLDYVFEDVE